MLIDFALWCKIPSTQFANRNTTFITEFLAATLKQRIYFQFCVKNKSNLTQEKVRKSAF